MADVITLSSDEETDHPPQIKRIKPALVETLSEVVILSDSEEIEAKVAPSPKGLALIEDLSPKSPALIEDPQTVKEVTIENGKETLQNGAGSSISEDASEKKLPEFLSTYLQVFEDSIKNTKYEKVCEKIRVIPKLFRSCSEQVAGVPAFLKLVEEGKKKAAISPISSLEGFNDIYKFLKEINSSYAVDVTEKEYETLKKLDLTIRKLLKRIKVLETTELEDGDDDENSSYMQLDRYITRLNSVYKKRCEILKRNEFSGRLTHERLGFVNSEYNEINRAINKKYKNNSKFPSYYEIEKFIRKVVQDNEMKLSELQIKTESQRCFQKLGELLQVRRKKELYEVHSMYLHGEDPALSDDALALTLKTNLAEGKLKIEKICEEFVVKQEMGSEINPQSEDESSDKSNYKDSEDDT